jgi:hypothetical protein
VQRLAFIPRHGPRSQHLHDRGAGEPAEHPGFLTGRLKSQLDAAGWVF